MKLLLIEDDELIVRSLAKALTEHHYAIDVATDGQAGLELAEAYTYDLILLDVGLPKLDGIRLCQRLRSQGNQTPILLITAQDNSTNRVMGLDAGADDYVSKPFDLQELLARIRALLRRGGVALPPLLHWRNLQLDPSSCEVTCNGRLLHLTPKEYGLLELFLRNSHRIFSCGALINHLWSFEEAPTDDTVRSHVKGLRQKLKAAGIADDPLETIYGIGYRLKSPEAEGRNVTETTLEIPKLGELEAVQVGGVNTAVLHRTPEPQAQGKSKLPAQTIWEQAKESFTRRVSVIEAAKISLLQNQLSDELRQQAEQEAHRLAGSLGMFGSDEGSRIAGLIEPLFAESHALDRRQKQYLSQLVDELQQELQHMSQGKPELLSLNCSTHERSILMMVGIDRAVADTFVAEATVRGLRSQTFTSPAIAKKQIAKHRPDVVLLHLPTKPDKVSSSPDDVLELLAELSSYTPPVPAIVVTTQAQLIDRVKLSRLGARRVLQAPVLPSQALEAVAQVLQHNRATEARVLVVDDDPAILTALQQLLEPWGMKVATLDEPLRFLDVLKTVAPDLLVLDVEMPHINGIELCQVVRNDPDLSGLPVLFLTAYTDAETMHRVFTAGADDFVSKPVVGPELVTRILNRLERSRLLRNLSETDALTAVANRRKSTQELTQRLAWSLQHQQLFCLAVLEVDQLKQINHEYGHAAGDQVLRCIGKLLRQTFQSEDVVGRWGGAEFVIGIMGMTPQDGEQRLAEVLESLRQTTFSTPTGQTFRATGSVGIVAGFPSKMELQALYQAADLALNQAQAAGGDRIICCEDTTSDG